MKKAISLLLALVLCLSLCACGGGEQNENTQPNSTNSNQSESMSAQNTPTDIVEQELSIVGEWLLANSTSEQTLIINEDGTGLYSTKNSSTELTWKYDADLKCYMLAVGEIVSAFVKEEDGIEQLLIGTNIFVHPDDYESSRAEYLAEEANAKVEKAKADVATKLVGKEPLEFEVPYQISDEFEITVLSGEFATHTTSQGDFTALWLTVEMRNLTDSEIGWSSSPFIQGGETFIKVNSSVTISGQCYFAYEYNIDESGKRVQNYPAQNTVKYMLPIWESPNLLESTKSSIAEFGYVLGYVIVSIGNVEYYIDLTSIPVNE